MKISVIVTSFKEPATISKAISAISAGIQNAISRSDLKNHEFEIIVVAPDTETLASAKQEATLHDNFTRITIIKDEGIGKWHAMNLAVEKAQSDVFVFTDGDVQVDVNAIDELIRKLDMPNVDSNDLSYSQPDLVAVGGHPLPTNSRDTMFGFFSHLFCEAANKRRLDSRVYTPISGYLLGVKNVDGLFPLPQNLKAEDAYISAWVTGHGYKIAHAKDAFVYVKFPSNFSDWIKQKTRSLGGNVQLSKFTADLPQFHHTTRRSILEDISMAAFPILYAKNIKEFGYSIVLYVLRLYLWIKIYLIHIFNKYKTGTWERIESTK